MVKNFLVFPVEEKAAREFYWTIVQPVEIVVYSQGTSPFPSVWTVKTAWQGQDSGIRQIFHNVIYD